MTKFLAGSLSALSLLTLVSCSNAQPQYDPVELIEYEKCLSNPPEYFDGVFTAPKNWAETACEDKRPVLK